MVVIRELASKAGSCQFCEPENARYKYVNTVRSSQSTSEARICSACVRDLNRIVKRIERNGN